MCLGVTIGGVYGDRMGKLKIFETVAIDFLISIRHLFRPFNGHYDHSGSGVNRGAGNLQKLKLKNLDKESNPWAYLKVLYPWAFYRVKELPPSHL